MDQYEGTQSSVIGVQTVPENETHRYGIIDPVEQNDRRYQVRQFVEKPEKGTAPSNLAIMGRYVLTPEIFMFLENQQTGAGGEIQLTDAIQRLNEIQRVFAYDFEGTRYDVGEKFGFIKTTIEMALQHKELRDELIKYMKELVEKKMYMYKVRGRVLTLMKVSGGEFGKRNSIELDREKVNARKSYLLGKRCVDVIGSLLGLVLLSPIFLIIVVLIKYEDPKGPVLFKQLRVGRDGKEFYMYKFRSMVTDAEDRLKDLLKYNEVSGAMFKMKEDPRITRIGKFIRRTSIDELPQLINVIQGDMSLVGPRPLCQERLKSILIMINKD